MDAFRRGLFDLWRAHAAAWETVRGAIADETGLRVWNPQQYGLPAYERFADHCLPRGPGAIVMFGLNPGKHGMAQTGLPFTDVLRARTALPSLGLDLEAPGLAPAELVPVLLPPRQERSSQSVYAWLERAWGSAEEGWRHVWAVTPCGLLFLEPNGTNVTPADARLARRHDMREMRRRVIAEAMDLAQPRGVILLGQDVLRLAGALVAEKVGAENVLVLDHPVARGPGRRGPTWWAETAHEALRARAWC